MQSPPRLETTGACLTDCGVVAAHRDNVCVDSKGEVDCHNSREVTAILYTSDTWSEDDGGCLRFYRTTNDDETGGDDYTDVAPKAGRMVIFRSRTVLHEVFHTSNPHCDSISRGVD